jgi:hypothetical protein
MRWTLSLMYKRNLHKSQQVWRKCPRLYAKLLFCSWEGVEADFFINRGNVCFCLGVQLAAPRNPFVSFVGLPRTVIWQPHKRYGMWPMRWCERKSALKSRNLRLGFCSCDESLNYKLSTFGDFQSKIKSWWCLQSKTVDTGKRSLSHL